MDRSKYQAQAEEASRGPFKHMMDRLKKAREANVAGMDSRNAPLTLTHLHLPYLH